MGLMMIEIGGLDDWVDRKGKRTCKRLYYIKEVGYVIGQVVCLSFNTHKLWI